MAATLLRTARDCAVLRIAYMAPSMAGTTTIRAPSVKPELVATQDTDSGWKVILFNDEITPFEIVIYGLQRAAGLSLEVAEMVALEAHQEDSAIVKRGLTEEDALIICGGLRRWTRIEGLCPGVQCEAARDDDS
jgi:ATP-dependent Clp protease adapter protein ClpS